MIWLLLLIPYLVVGFLVWGFASAMSHGEVWWECLGLGLLWPIYGLIFLGFMAAFPLRERLIRRAVRQEILEVEAERDNAIREKDEYTWMIDEMQRDYEPKAETVQRWRREGEANGTVHHEFVPKEIGNQVACEKCGVGPGAFVHVLWSTPAAEGEKQ